MAMRYDTWKVTVMEQRMPGHSEDLAGAVGFLAVPKLFNLCTDPYERADITSNTYWDWVINHVFLFIPTQAIAADFLNFVQYPPRQKAASFTIDQVLEKLQRQGGSNYLRKLRVRPAYMDARVQVGGEH
jgi:hypothetical protein